MAYGWLVFFEVREIDERGRGSDRARLIPHFLPRPEL